MITAKDVRAEMKEASEVIESTETDVTKKIQALFKFLTVVAKVVLGTRLNVVRVMDKLGVEKVKPTTKDEKTEEKK